MVVGESHRMLLITLFCASSLAWGGFEWLRHRRERRAGVDCSRDRGSLRLIHRAIWLCVMLAMAAKFYPPLHRPGLDFSSSLSMLPATFLLWLGIALRLTAMHTLGPYFKFVVVIQSEHRIVQRGIYRYLRHPAYTGGLLILIAYGISFGNWISFAFMVLSFAAVVRRIFIEEAALEQSLGQQYRDYMKHTWRLIPGIW
jgi:protein-S-isoprenylcysteine O-methyltransferase